MTITCAPAHHPAVGFRMAPASSSIHGVGNSTGARRYQLQIPDATPETPATARAWVRTVLGDAGIDPDATELGASELLGNVARHAPGAARLALTISAAMVVLSVSDEHPEIPVALPKTDSVWDLDAEGGRGLAIIAAMAEISVRRAKGRKRVTARFPIGGEQ